MHGSFREARAHPPNMKLHDAILVLLSVNRDPAQKPFRPKHPKRLVEALLETYCNPIRRNLLQRLLSPYGALDIICIRRPTFTPRQPEDY